MKRLFTLLFISSITGLSAQAQVDTVECSDMFNDTLAYTKGKSSGLNAISVNNINDGGSYGYAAYAQYFEVPASITLTGISFLGFDNGAAAPTPAAVLIYSGAAGGFGTLLDSIPVTLPVIPGYSGDLYDDNIRQNLSLTSDLELTSDFIVVFRNYGNGDYYVVRSNDGDGGENYCFTYYEGVSDPQYDGWYVAQAFGAGWNFDMIYEPIVSYEGGSQHYYDMDGDSICAGDSLFISSDFMLNDSVFSHRMYNPNFAMYNGYSVSNEYEYGDGNENMSGDYAYEDGGDMTITAWNTVMITGWSFDSLMVGCDHDIYVGLVEPDLGMDTTLCHGDSLYLEEIIDGDYMWSTGEQTMGIDVGPWTAADSSYDYVLTVSDMGCSGSDTVTVNVMNCTSIEEISVVNKVYPNPAKENLTIELDFWTKSEVRIYDLNGRLVENSTYQNDILNVDVSGLEQGIYILEVSAENRVQVIKLEIMK